MTHKLIPTLIALTLFACGGQSFAPQASLPDALVDDGSVDGGSAAPDAGHTMEHDAGTVVPDAGAPELDAGHVDPPVDAGEVDSGLPEHDAGTMTPADAGSAEDAGDGEGCPVGERLVMGSTCGRQTVVSCVARWAECGLIGQGGCNMNGSTGGALCYEGARFSGTGFCVACR